MSDFPLATAAFWTATAERVISTMAQALLAVAVAGDRVLGILDVNWPSALSVTALAGLACVLKCVIAARTGNVGPSLANERLAIRPQTGRHAKRDPEDEEPDTEHAEVEIEHEPAGAPSLADELLTPAVRVVPDREGGYVAHTYPPPDPAAPVAERTAGRVRVSHEAWPPQRGTADTPWPPPNAVPDTPWPPAPPERLADLDPPTERGLVADPTGRYSYPPPPQGSHRGTP